MVIEEIKDWFHRPLRPRINRDRVMELYFTYHPRTSFLKMLPTGAVVVDIGAGDGSLSVFRTWPSLERGDIRMYAYSIEKGRLFDEFDGYEISDWNTAPPDFEGMKFDAVICAHFIEHIADPSSLVDWAARKLNPGGRIYLEWPSVNSLVQPSRAELEKVGVPLIISRFDDDHTHRDLPDCDAIIAAAQERDLVVEGKGIVRLPWLEDEMLAHFRDADDGFPRQAAFWSYSGWSQYLVMRLAADSSSRVTVNA
jgi:SAM-dependent methyltransferase